MKINARTSLARLVAAIVTLTAATNARAIDLLVVNNNDAGNGSLRTAILDNNSLGGGNTIIFGVGGTITLTGGELLITKNVTIIGPGASLLAVSGNNAHRVFNITNSTVSISGLTIAHGSAGSSEGGGIHNLRSNLILSNCTVSVNDGGGIYNDGSNGGDAELTIVASTISGNSVNTNLGYAMGGIRNWATQGGSATLTIVNSTLSGNSGNTGGGILNFTMFNGTATVTIVNSTLSGNSCGGDAGYGGGIYNIAKESSSSTLMASNCTISGNSAGRYGGGVFNSSLADSRTTVIIRACTLSGNSCGDGDGGGIYNGNDTFLNGSTVEVGDTILKTGTSGGNIYNIGGVVISDGYNLCSDGGVVNALGGTGSLNVSGDQINTDPLLGPLQDNGGPTRTHMPLPGSPAIDKGKNLAGLATDQRGRCRTYDDPGIPNATGGDGSDIGAVEVNPVHTTIVGTNSDNGVSLRYCICEAQPGEAVTFGVTGTIALTAGELLIGKSLTILGPTAAGVTVSGNNATRVFHITAGTVSISSLTIANGNSSGQGAGIWNEAFCTLVLSNCTISANSSGDSGGGISNQGILTAVNCTFYGNHAGNAGGIYNYTGTVNLFNSTVASNSAVFAGGGVYYYPFGGSITVRSSLIASNSAPDSPDVKGSTFTSQGYNLIGNVGVSSGFFAPGDQTGVDPKLGPLADNGGPTKTMALRVGSPAIDKGKSFGLTTDQRGQLRYDNPNVANVGGGDGADIGAYEATELRIVNAQKTGNHLRLDYINWLGTNYEVQSRADLNTGSWGTVGGTNAGNGGIASWTVSNVFGVPKQFYRIHPVP